ncbi:hypothetical protein CORC01_05460 [Colletotrichum orchidophilum]|uniref:Uncharacterized protein n=1 Tax=Colletotrichum orchidophilum TaxID=1209926 RepID=A0A1G4BCM3_9PEZI|nr:uncharacterized protein CORC01_05460 [Colletotrichum orchidophilum]OHE99179.1 hypothetical protein CORC01_05460 [Colletotrichum orchidophilum]
MRGTLCKLVEVCRGSRDSLALLRRENRSTVVCLCPPRRQGSGPAGAIMMTSRAQAGMVTGATLHKSRRRGYQVAWCP